MMKRLTGTWSLCALLAVCLASLPAAWGQRAGSSGSQEDQIVAKANGCVVTLREVNDVIIASPGNHPTFETKKQLVEALLLHKIVLLAAEQEGLNKEPEVQREIQRAHDRARESVYYSRYIIPQNSEERSRQYYDTHPDEFTAPPQISVKQILVKTEAEARVIKAELERGKSFDALARERSSDQATAAKGGDLGWLRPGPMGTEFDRIAFALEPGQVSEIFSSPAGFHMLKVREKIPARKMEWQEVKARVIEQLRVQAMREAKQRLMGKWKPKVNEEALTKAANSTAPEGTGWRVSGSASLILAQAAVQVITLGEFNQLLQQYPPQTVATPQQRTELLHNLLLSRLFILEANEKGLDRLPETQVKFRAAREKALSDSYYYKHAVTLVTEQRLRDYYESHVSEYVNVPKIRTRHILVPTEQEARAIKAQLETGADFKTLAAEKSADQSTARVGGYLGWKEKGSLAPEFEQAAYRLNPGQISDVVKTASGYHVILLEEKIPSFEQARAAIYLEEQERAFEMLNRKLLRDWEANINEGLLK